MSASACLQLPAVLWHALEGLIWPAQCAGCRKWDTQLCPDCLALALQRPIDTEIDDEVEVPCWPLSYVGPYFGPLRNVILAAKHDRNLDLTRFLRLAGVTLGAHLADSSGFPSPGPRARDVDVWLVCPPSSAKRKRERREVTPIVAEGVAAGLARARPDLNVELVEALVQRRRISGARSQAGRGLRSRERARSGSIVVARRPPAGVRVVLVDDVCASGATLRECAKVLGDQVVAMVAVAAS